MQAIYYRPSSNKEWKLVHYDSGALDHWFAIQSMWRGQGKLSGEIVVVKANIVLVPTRWTLDFKKGEARVIWRGRLKSCFPNKWERIQQNGRKVWRPVNERQESFKWKETR